MIVEVCRDAFALLSGIHPDTLQMARKNAVANPPRLRPYVRGELPLYLEGARCICDTFFRHTRVTHTVTCRMCKCGGQLSNTNHVHTNQRCNANHIDQSKTHLIVCATRSLTTPISNLRVIILKTKHQKQKKRGRNISMLCSIWKADSISANWQSVTWHWTSISTLVH